MSASSNPKCTAPPFRPCFSSGVMVNTFMLSSPLSLEAPKTSPLSLRGVSEANDEAISLTRLANPLSGLPSSTQISCQLKLPPLALTSSSNCHTVSLKPSSSTSPYIGMTSAAFAGFLIVRIKFKDRPIFSSKRELEPMAE